VTDPATTTPPPAPAANDTAVVPARTFPRARPARAASEARRARSGEKRGRLKGRVREDGTSSTGHPALFSMRPAIELDPFPDAGGYPNGFVETAADLMCVNLADIVHLCAGSVRGGRLTIDARSQVLKPRKWKHMAPDVVADVRWLPLGAGTVDAFLIDPPYDRKYANELYGTGRIYPAPLVVLRECAHALRPGGRVGFLHHLVPTLPPELDLVSVHGVWTGPGYRIRAFTIAERRQPEDLGALPFGAEP